jgi:dGTPase
MDGCFESSLIKNISPGALQALHQVIDVSVDRVYSHSSVVEIELAGYKIISTLIEHFIEALIDSKHSKYNSKLMKLFPDQFLPQQGNTYSKIQSVVDFISGMTDVYALELYRKITGISLPGIG